MFAQSSSSVLGRNRLRRALERSSWVRLRLLHEFHRMSFEPFFAGHAAEMISFALVGDLEFGGVLVKNCATYWIFRHDFDLNLSFKSDTSVYYG